MQIEDLVERRRLAKGAAENLLGNHEESPSRVVELRKSLESLSNLPIDAAEYYREALTALQVECYRASIVFAWAGFIHSFAAKLVQGYQAELSANYSRWNSSTAAELLETVAEFQILEAGKKCGLIKSHQLHIYKGWLSTRNQCAHPTLYKPSRNTSLGFVDGLISEVRKYL